MIDFLAMDFLKHNSKLAKYFLGACVLYRIVSAYIEGEGFRGVFSKKLSPPQRSPTTKTVKKFILDHYLCNSVHRICIRVEALLGTTHCVPQETFSRKPYK